ncbi:MAG: V-type ATP synthase subunit I [Candidatus Limivicinus sp.]|nr:V-type ATP synthase subunit I [Clostridiales bacterium]MDY3860151.1 V-type ATP synthase subunit I [Candidatus Limivicinus sp.]
MAILKMKKLRLLAVRSGRDELLQELIRYGCVEFSELAPEIQGSEIESLVRRESSDIASLKSRHTSLTRAIELLDRYAPVKAKLLSARPELEDRVLLDDTGLSGALKIAESIESHDSRIKRISAEESRLRSVIQSLDPWMELDMPLNTEGTERCGVLIGTVPARIELSQVESALEQVDEESELFCVHEEKKEHYVVLVCMREKLPDMQECLRGFGFTASALGSMDGTARECAAQADTSLKELAAEKESCVEYIIGEAVHRDELKLAADRVSVRISLAEAADKLYGTDSVVVMEGWFPEEREPELSEVFERFGCAWEALEPTEEEYPDVPVKLKNNKFTNALNMVTNMYSLPAYGSLDPNPLMAPFFILFYGLMMADMGYGLIMVIAAVVAMKRIRPRAGTLSFCQLLLYCGISTFVMGAVTGGFFGDALEKIGAIIGKPEGWGALPCLFSPLKDTMYVLVGAMGLGLVHLNTGMVINAVKKIRRGQVADAVWEEGSLWVMLVGIILCVFKIGNVSGVPVVLVIGIVMLFYGGSRGSKGILGKLGSIFGTFYNTATGWFGDILSYSRIMALMLAGSVIATVFNTIGAIANNLVFFFVIFIIGHSLNFALNLLGCYVHDLRLQCLEYFGKFYEDGGRPFNPLTVKTKYYDVSE